MKTIMTTVQNSDLNDCDMLTNLTKVNRKIGTKLLLSEAYPAYSLTYLFDDGHHDDHHGDYVDDDDEENHIDQVRQMFNNPVHRRLLARLLKVELEVIPSRFPPKHNYNFL